MMESLSKEEYFFYEWLILKKRMTIEDFKRLSHEELEKLILEYIEWKTN